MVKIKNKSVMFPSVKRRPIEHSYILFTVCLESILGVCVLLEDCGPLESHMWLLSVNIVLNSENTADFYRPIQS